MTEPRIFLALGVACVAVVAACLGWSIAAGETITICAALASLVWCSLSLARTVVMFESCARVEAEREGFDRARRIALRATSEMVETVRSAAAKVSR